MIIALFIIGAALVVGWWIAVTVSAAIATYQLWKARRK